MLKEIHKFARETSRPIAMNGTQKHTHGYINGVVQPRNEHVESPKNARVAQLKRHTGMIAQ